MALVENHLKSLRIWKSLGKSVRLENKWIDKFGFFYIQQLEKMQQCSPINFSTSIISICDNYSFP